MSEALADHSSPTRIRQRWVEEDQRAFRGKDRPTNERFRAIFARVARDCQRAGLVAGDVVHMDATRIRADVSLGSLAARHLDAVDLADLDEQNRLSRGTGKFKKLCVTDPDATMAASPAGAPAFALLQAAYLCRCRVGIIVDIEVVTGEESDFPRVSERLDALEVTLGRSPDTVTADRAYGIGRVYAELANRDIDAVIPPRPVTRPGRAKGFQLRGSATMPGTISSDARASAYLLRARPAKPDTGSGPMPMPVGPAH